MKTHQVFAILLAIFLPMPHGFAAETKNAEPISVGIVPQFDLRRIDAVWSPILDKLAERTGLRFRLEVPPSISAFEKSLMAGEYDLAYMNPYHYLIASKRHGYEPLVRDHGSNLSGIIVVAIDSPITQVGQLNGKVVAFPSPNAMGAALLQRAEFARKFHITVTEKYVRSHSSAYLAVLLNEADAACGIASTLALLPESSRQKLRILHETEQFPPHPLAAHPRLGPAQHDNIAKSFLALAKTPEGNEHIKEIPMRDPGLARAADYAGLARLDLQKFYIEE